VTIADNSIVHVEQVMGTVVSFHVEPGACPDGDARRVIALAAERLHELDGIFSTWVPTSPMSLFRSGRLLADELPPEIPLVLDLCREARRLSGGFFDPWAMPGGVDPTGLVKGWAVEQALELLSEAGVAAASVSAGGDVGLLGEPPGGGRWRIGVRHPWREDALACIILADAAVATSGCYERGAHLLNPRSPGGRIAAVSATVTGKSLAMADALATALAVGGEPVFELVGALDGYEAYWIGPGGDEHASDGITFG
jgi:thiamine biosynthesis lipoprotein